MEGLELVCFKIIASVGEARNSFLQSYRNAKRKKLEDAKKYFADGDEFFNKAHEAHAQLITQEANEESVQVNLLLVHAEDQLMSVETLKLIAEEEIAYLEG
ncbi:MAG: PTS lactose/cellobiose transporter subunit IIA [Erysipelotrichaceae bacterium]|nr:PTS lactose/cellobiose transporter subunit IIA [Erysipelotrichaceae bacterium]MDY6034728.1 PTS lactose/cellobiose transporter subunit IIA [Bulleidia sp.]